MSAKTLALLISLVVLAGGAFAAVVLPEPSRDAPADDPRAHVPLRAAPTDHAAFFSEPFPDGPSVTRRCLECHEDAAHEVMATTHWTWGGAPSTDPSVATFGKRTALNDFCIGVASNWPRCTSCHAGYGWTDDGFLDRARPEDVDCLVCHDASGLYRKDPVGAGLPAKDVDLLAAARSVGRSGRANCGSCHFDGGGGDGVKHGDLDQSLVSPPERIDVHMGVHGLGCADCHRTEGHRVRGRLMPPEVAPDTRVRCEDCHVARPHGDDRLDGHVAAVACQACHVPLFAVQTPTKLWWDWSLAGRDGEPEALAASLAREARERPDVPEPVRRGFVRLGEDPDLAAHYDRKKGLFLLGRRRVPEYRWTDGSARRTAPGERFDGEPPLRVNEPRGSVADPRSRIAPFKVHRGVQPFDLDHRHLLAVHTFGPGGYWTEFDWERALREGAAASGIPYGGRRGWIATEMWWPQNHMVQAKEKALGCTDCHGEGGRMDWAALGYPGDPAEVGGRSRLGLLAGGER